jgi:hypothetical protein
MGKYTMIADTSQRIVEMLSEALVPDLISNSSEIGLRSPEDRNDITLGVFLYDVRPNDEIYQRGPVVRNERISRAPLYLSLFYMITAYSKGNEKYRQAHEQQILGRVLQLFHDNAVIPLGDVDPMMTSGTELHIKLQTLGADEKSRVWSFPNVGNKLSLFYKVSPVAIDSAESAKVTRVTDMDINVGIRLGENHN